MWENFDAIVGFRVVLSLELVLHYFRDFLESESTPIIFDDSRYQKLES